MRDYRKIKAWKLADDLVVKIYEMTTHFPEEERFAMISQIRRAAYSVPANIAEGAGRGTAKDYLRFLNIAKGSLNETDYFLHLGCRLGYIRANEHCEMVKMMIETSKCLTGLIKFIENDG
jgi:four helix bundle protein